MDDDLYFRCDYCSEVVHVDRAEVWYRRRDQLLDGRTLAVYATYCGSFCARMHSATSVSAGLSG